MAAKPALFRYGNTLTSHDIIKATAILLMVIDHTGRYLLQDAEIWRLVGRFSFPLFFFLIGYGTAKTSRTGRALLLPADWLLGILLLSLERLWLHQDILPFDILVSAIAARAFLFYANQNEWLKPAYLPALLLTLLLLYLPLMLIFEYGSTALLFALYGYNVANGYPKSNTLTIAIVSALFYTYTQTVSMAFPVAHIILLGAGMLALTLKLQHYHAHATQLSLRTLPHRVIALISRYSLAIYVLHLMLFRWLFILTN